MSDKKNLTEQQKVFVEKYARPRSSILKEITSNIIGHDAGLNGYTTLAQAQMLSEQLNLEENDYLLDLGCGFGWPGFHVAECSGCNVIATDLTPLALQHARRQADAFKMKGNVDFVAVDATELPFPTDFFSAIIHSDVMC